MQLLLGICPSEINVISQKPIHEIFIAALFLTAQTGDNQDGPQLGNG